MSASTPRLLTEVLELACRAPSVHNSQPWAWHLVDDTLVELYADRGRQLRFSDPDGRNLVISCGAALQHAAVAARALGLRIEAERVPDGTRRDLLARLHLSAGRPAPDAEAVLDTLAQRCTDRRRFTAWPVPDSRVRELAESAGGWGALAVPLTSVAARFRAELLIERAMTVQAADRRFAGEQAAWVERSRSDGLPAGVAVPPLSARHERPNRFAGAHGPRSSARMVESSDGLMAICTSGDDQVAWLQAGETLSALWLEATSAGMSIVPLSQAVEVVETRESLRADVVPSGTHPQLLLRVGWQEIGRASLVRTPRRPLSDVLVDATAADAARGGRARGPEENESVLEQQRGEDDGQ